ncbi:bile acid:sodium symporter family protein [Aminobacter sp. Piv2-1]|uniref:bile acid:sodium symporter family protein n=1 Tax=Aminobacter sp. Piv2-1 TaxID=3031122 RepID=UPI0030B2A1F5
MFSRFRPDVFILLMIASVVLASLLPAQGSFTSAFGTATNLAIALLFFLHGARLSRATVIAGMTHWRLHFLVFSSTFVLFPILGLALGLLVPSVLPAALYAGVLFLCVLPSTVQSSIAFTALAGGNVPAAVRSASASNIIGMFLTPLLVGLLLTKTGNGAVSLSAIEGILLQLLAPFVAGQALQPLLAGWLGRHKWLTTAVDRGSILMVIYLAFSKAMVSGLRQQLPAQSLAVLFAIAAFLLSTVLAITICASRFLGFSRQDEITVAFCGSHKSLASGVPMANVIFDGQEIGAIVLPLMLYHQLQLMVCAWLARRYAERRAAEKALVPGTQEAAE